MHEQRPKDEFDPFYTSLEESGDIFKSPFTVAVFGHSQYEWLGVGQIVGVRKGAPANEQNSRNPIIQLHDPLSPNGIVELIGGIDCLWTPEHQVISTMNEIANECPGFIISAQDYVRQLRAHLN